MSRITVGECYRLARDVAGLSPTAATLAVAVAIGESGLIVERVGDINNPKAGCVSLGLWQINSCPNRDEGSIRWDRAALLTAEGNARAMGQISRGGSHWSPWTVFTSGKYRAHLADVAAVVAGRSPDHLTGPARYPAQPAVPGVPRVGPGQPSSPGAQVTQVIDLTPGFDPSDLNPFKLPGKLAGKAGGELMEALVPLALRMTFVLGGVALVVAGFYRGVQPTIDRTRDKAQQAAALVVTKGASAA